MQSTSPPRTLATIDGWPINLADADAAVSQIIWAAKQGEGFTVFTLNLDHLDKLRRLPRFRKAYANAHYVTADGAPVALLASAQDHRIKRTTGADLIIPLTQAAAQANVPIYLFGTTERVLIAAASDLSRRTGFALNVVGAESPEVDFDPQGPSADAALKRIAASGARLCFVALGAPKQEYFAARAMELGINVGFVCIGAGLDFLAGTQSRAPEFMQRNGLEWMWRLATNPRRLGVRYARCGLILAKIILLKTSRGPSAKSP